MAQDSAPKEIFRAYVPSQAEPMKPEKQNHNADNPGPPSVQFQSEVPLRDHSSAASWEVAGLEEDLPTLEQGPRLDMGMPDHPSSELPQDSGFVPESPSMLPSVTDMLLLQYSVRMQHEVDHEPGSPDLSFVLEGDHLQTGDYPEIEPADLFEVINPFGFEPGMTPLLAGYWPGGKGWKDVNFQEGGPQLQPGKGSFLPLKDTKCGDWGLDASNALDLKQDANCSKTEPPDAAGGRVLGGVSRLCSQVNVPEDQLVQVFTGTSDLRAPFFNPDRGCALTFGANTYGDRCCGLLLLVPPNAFAYQQDADCGKLRTARPGELAVNTDNSCGLKQGKTKYADQLCRTWETTLLGKVPMSTINKIPGDRSDPSKFDKCCGEPAKPGGEKVYPDATCGKGQNGENAGQGLRPDLDCGKPNVSWTKNTVCHKDSCCGQKTDNGEATLKDKCCATCSNSIVPRGDVPGVPYSGGTPWSDSPTNKPTEKTNKGTCTTQAFSTPAGQANYNDSTYPK